MLLWLWSFMLEEEEQLEEEDYPIWLCPLPPLDTNIPVKSLILETKRRTENSLWSAYESHFLKLALKGIVFEEYENTQTCTDTHRHPYTDSCTQRHAETHTHTYTHTQTCMDTHIQIYTQTNTCTHTHAHSHIHTYIQRHGHTCRYTHRNTHTHLDMYIHMSAHMHTETHIGTR